MTKRSVVVVAAVTVVSAGVALADTAYFMGLGDMPGGIRDSTAYGVSADGSTIVGEGSSDAGWCEAFRWTAATGMVGLGSLGDPITSTARGVSPNGQVVVGEWDDRGWAYFRWSAEGGMVHLVPVDPDQPRSWVHDVTDAGVAVGYSSGLPVKWALDGQPIPLDLPADHERGVARAITPDGSLIVGSTRLYEHSSPSWNAVIWSADEEVRVITEGHAGDVTPDGRIVVGTDHRVWRWSADEGKVYLGWVSDPLEEGVANAVSADGSVIVGWINDEPRNNAFVWDAENGIRHLKTALEGEFGLDLSEWQLQRAYGVSADGRTIVGRGMHNGYYEAWVAYIPEPSGLCLLALMAACASRARPAPRP